MVACFGDASIYQEHSGNAHDKNVRYTKNYAFGGVFSCLHIECLCLWVFMLCTLYVVCVVRCIFIMERTEMRAMSDDVVLCCGNCVSETERERFWC